MDIYPLRTLETNYTYILSGEEGVLVIDPGEFSPVDRYLKDKGFVLDGILLTHKHWDHIDGAQALSEAYSCPLYGGENEKFPFLMAKLAHGNSYKIAGFSISVMHLPGHTMGAVAFVIEDNVFTGDVLFGAGCGRIFEGSAEDMLLSLDRLANLNDSMKVYFAHEYTRANLAFAKEVEANNENVHARYCALTERTVPSTILLEKATNPFLRIDEQSVIKAIEGYFEVREESRSERLRLLREWKNQFDQGAL